MKELRVAVVGGGLAGLAAALECADVGASVTLFEARRRLGGATFSIRRKGYWLDNGQHVALRCCTAYRSFLRRIGVEQHLEIQPRLRIPVLGADGSAAVPDRTALPPTRGAVTCRRERAARRRPFASVAVVRLTRRRTS